MAHHLISIDTNVDTSIDKNDDHKNDHHDHHHKNIIKLLILKPSVLVGSPASADPSLLVPLLSLLVALLSLLGLVGMLGLRNLTHSCFESLGFGPVVDHLLHSLVLLSPAFHVLHQLAVDQPEVLQVLAAGLRILLQLAVYLLQSVALFLQSADL